MQKGLEDQNGTRGHSNSKYQGCGSGYRVYGLGVQGIGFRV